MCQPDIMKYFLFYLFQDLSFDANSGHKITNEYNYVKIRKSLKICRIIKTQAKFEINVSESSKFLIKHRRTLW